MRALRREAEWHGPLLLCRFVAGLQHVYQSWRKPFNPILGETFESVLSDGSRVYVEQISHHPPISAFQLDGPGKLPLQAHAPIPRMLAQILLSANITLSL